MKNVKLKYTRGEVNKAGDIFRDTTSSDESLLWAADVLGNWRAIHNYPINTFQATLRHKLKTIDNKSLVAQRLKRIPSIVEKLRRFTDMQLARMQDIGGLRAVVDNLIQVQKLYENYKSTPFQHKLISERNYIDSPKISGYRSIHLVYRYNNKTVTDYNGLLIELQIRTRQQHAWATAVETMGIFLNYALKSSEGPDEWLTFFSLTGSAFAHLENQNPVPGYEGLSNIETYRHVAKKSQELNVRSKLTGFGAAINLIHSDERRGTYYLLILDPGAKTIRLQAYSRDRFDIATADYLKAEEQIVKGSQNQAVLVATESIESLRRAYPNFFLDTHEFFRILKHIEDLAVK
ncbi:MAG: RelA/SpoT domain-containing protein [Candidatus Latescibacter sp.]|nr:RelA/SpoT domain-containing protein [Candidatus Latescibacter sp.]